MTKEQISKAIGSSWVSQIRSGTKHRFIEISIVEAEGRFFVRQYKFGKGGWRDAFLNHAEGEMKLGDAIIPIVGKMPDDLEAINPKVTRAFWKKFHILYFIMRLGYNTKKHADSTIELLPKDE